METNELLKKRAIDLTAGELAKVVAFEIADLHLQKIDKSTPTYSYKGIKGIMEIFHCAKSKAVGIRASKVIDDACIQYGNTFLIDKALALQLMREKTNKNIKHRNTSSLLYNNIY